MPPRHLPRQASSRPSTALSSRAANCQMSILYSLLPPVETKTSGPDRLPLYLLEKLGNLGDGAVYAGLVNISVRHEAQRIYTCRENALGAKVPQQRLPCPRPIVCIAFDFNENHIGGAVQHL